MSIASWLSSTFNWGKEESSTGNPTRRAVRRPSPRDISEQLTVNETLTRQLYHNSYPGLKLAGGFAYPIIAIPCFFMGLPAAVDDDGDETLNEILQEIGDLFFMSMQQIHIQCHREGTIWVWPRWNAEENKPEWEFIPDSSVTDIVRNIETGKIIKLVVNEQLTLMIDENRTANVDRKRVFTQDVVTVTYSGDAVPQELTAGEMRNPSGIIPIPFANNSDGDEVRGHSDYERILSDLKNYHDIDLAESNILAKFSVKMLLGVDDVDQWLVNNSIDDVNDLDIQNIDLLFYLKDREDKPDFVWPERAVDNYEKALKRIFRKLVEESGIPELVWGVKTEGNANTAEEQLGTLVQFVKDRQRRKTVPYQILYAATVRLWGIATGRQLDTTNIVIEWNDLDAISDRVKSEIFLNFSRGMGELYNRAAITEEQSFNLWTQNFPKATEQDFDDWKAGLRQMSTHKQFTEASYADVLDMAGNRLDESGNVVDTDL